MTVHLTWRAPRPNGALDLFAGNVRVASIYVPPLSRDRPKRYRIAIFLPGIKADDAFAENETAEIAKAHVEHKIKVWAKRFTALPPAEKAA